MSFPMALNHEYMDVWGSLNKTSSYFVMIGLSLFPNPYGSPTSHVIRDHLYLRVLNSFVLLIHKGASWCSFAESLLWWWKIWLRLSMFCFFFCFIQHLRVDVFLNSTVILLCYRWLSVYIRHHLLCIIRHTFGQNSIKDSYQLTADCYHWLLLFQRIICSGRIILMQGMELRVLRYQWNCSIEQYRS